MCGFLGAIGSQQFKSLDCHLIRHRGPDAENKWKSSEGGLKVEFAHARLSIFDLLDRSNQPMVSMDGRYVFVYNGEIYNYLELKKDLLNQGIIFETESDTEVFMQGLIKEGPDFQLKCNGMWAFCLWDKQLQKALLGRDRFGEKPLYYSISESTGELLFSSELKGLVPYISDLKLNTKIDEMISNVFRYEYTSETVIDKIFKIQPGHFIIYKNKKITVDRWWNTLDHLVSPPNSYKEQVKQWRELFIDAVKLRMRADVPIGNALSGGLDSSSILATMKYIKENLDEKNLAEDWENSFISHFPGSSIDELRWAKIVTNNLGTNLNILDMNTELHKISIVESLTQVEDPYLTIPIPMLATYKKISHAGIKVTLDGHGADELFGGYGDYKDLFTIKNSFLLNNELLYLLYPKQFMRVRSNLVYKVFFLGFLISQNIVKAGINRSIRFLRHMFVLFKLKSKLSKIYFEDENHINFINMDPVNKKFYKMFHFTILPTLLRNYDKYSMSAGVEIRMPFLDWRLVVYTFSLPWESKIKDGYTKRIMRDALKDITPDEILNRRDKIGWNAPLHEWFRNDLKKDFDYLLRYSNVPRKIVRKWKRFERRSSTSFAQGQKIWNAVLPYVWKKWVFGEWRRTKLG